MGNPNALCPASQRSKKDEISHGGYQTSRGARVAVVMRRYQIISALLTTSQHKNPEGLEVLFFVAVNVKSIKGFQILLNYVALATQVDLDMECPLHDVAKYNLVTFLPLLFEAGAAINQQNIRGRTP